MIVEEQNVNTEARALVLSAPVAACFGLYYSAGTGIEWATTLLALLFMALLVMALSSVLPDAVLGPSR